MVTGDTVLTTVQHGDGQYTVQVERLTGATGVEYTLSTQSSNFPAYPPPDVPHALFSEYPKDHLTIPYARQATLAVSSRNYVFYAVNPANQVYCAYLEFCGNPACGGPTLLPQFGVIMETSFSPICIWRVSAYVQCMAGCCSNLVSQVDVPGAFSNGTYDGGAGLRGTWVRYHSSEDSGVAHGVVSLGTEAA